MNFTNPKKMIDNIIAKHDKDGDGIKDHQEIPVRVKDDKDGFFKRIWTPIRTTLAGENGVGRVLAVIKDFSKHLIPYGNIIDKATDIIGDQLKTKEDSKTMITLKHPKTTITGSLLIIAGILHLFLGVDSVEWDFAGIAESVLFFLSGSGLIAAGDGKKSN